MACTLALTLATGSSADVVVAEGSETGDPTERTAGQVVGEADPEASSPEASEVYALPGVVVSWDAQRKSMGTPDAGRAAILARSFSRWLADQAADPTSRLPFSKALEVENLPGGIQRARVPYWLINASTVTRTPEGSLTESCGHLPRSEDEGPSEGTESPAGEVWR